jgi:hypothetical protein
MKSAIFEYLTKSFGNIAKYQNNERLWWRDSEGRYLIEYIEKEGILWVDLDFIKGFYDFFDIDSKEGEEYLMRWAEKYLNLPKIKHFNPLPF